MKFTKEELDELHATALKQYEATQDKERDSRDQAIEDMRFTNVVGAQSEDDFDKRADVYKGEINRVAGLVDQVTGGQRENRSSIKYIPTGDGVDNDTAEVKSGLARNIENLSDASTIYDQGFDETVTGGYGGWGLVTEYEEDGFNQRIKLRGIRSAASSLYFDVNAVEYNKKDAKHAFLVTGVHPDLFASEYPNASIHDFPVQKYSNADWFSDDQVLCAEYWWKEPYKKTIALLSDGRVIDIKEEADVIDELAASGAEILKTRTVETHKVYMMKMNGAEWLSDPKEFPSKYIPLVPEYGRISHIENKTYIRGLIRFAKDAQRIYNYETSNQVQIGAEMMDDPVWVTAAQAKGYESQFNNYKTERPPVMLFNADPENPGPPSRTGAPSVQQGAMVRIKQAEMDIYATTNMYPPSLGLNVGLESGVALKHQDEKGDRGSYVFIDNHLKSIKYTGEIIEDMISRVYDTEQVVAILNIDGSVESVPINQMQKDSLGIPMIDTKTGKEVVVNDLTAKFGTVVDVSPAFSTQKKESLDQLLELIAADDTFRQISTDLLAKNASVLESDELYKRSRKLMINQGIAEPTEEESEDLGLNQDQPVDPAQQALTDNLNMDTEKKMTEITLNDAKEAQTVADTQKKTIDGYEVLIKTIMTKTEAGIPLNQDDIKLMRDSQAMIEIAQNAVKG
jgi:hypothetical protein